MQYLTSLSRRRVLPTMGDAPHIRCVVLCTDATAPMPSMAEAKIEQLPWREAVSSALDVGVFVETQPRCVARDG